MSKLSVFVKPERKKAIINVKDLRKILREVEKEAIQKRKYSLKKLKGE